MLFEEIGLGNYYPQTWFNLKLKYCPIGLKISLFILPANTLQEVMN